MLSLGRAQRAAHRLQCLVLGRQPPAAVRIVAGIDGAAARARGQCRRRHHGGKLSAARFMTWLDGRLAADVYVSAASDDAQRDRDQGVAARAAEVTADRCPADRADTQLAGAPIEVLRPARSRRPIATTGRCCEPATNAWVRLRPGDAAPGQRATGAARRTFDRRQDRGAGTGRRLAARDRSASTPTTATPRARSPSISPR